MVVCNLYEFDKAIANNANEDELIENIDIGGPTMIRAAAKNYEGVTILTSPAQYDNFITELDQDNEISFPTEEQMLSLHLK